MCLPSNTKSYTNGRVEKKDKKIIDTTTSPTKMYEADKCRTHDMLGVIQIKNTTCLFKDISLGKYVTMYDFIVHVIKKIW